MKRQIIAFITAGAIATTGIGAAPARADQNDDWARMLMGMIVMGAMASATNDGRSRVTVTHGRNHYAPRHRVRDHRHRHRPHGRRHVQPPQQCIGQFWNQNGWTTFYRPRCMTRHGWVQRHGRWVKPRHARW